MIPNIDIGIYTWNVPKKGEKAADQKRASAASIK